MNNCYVYRDKAPIRSLYRRQVAKHAISTSAVLCSRGRLAIAGVLVLWIFFILLISQPQDTFGQQVLASARKCFPGTIHSAKDSAAPAGFIHAYDLTRLLIAAVEKVRLSGDIIRDRAQVRAGLEQLDNPVRGLIKTYRRPFRPFDRNHPDAHEALSGKDLHMAHYQQDNTIVLLK